MSDVDVCLYSNHHVRSLTAMWIVDNFSLLVHEPGEYIESPCVPLSVHEKEGFCIQMYPNGKSSDCSNHVAMFVKSSMKQAVTAKYVLSFVNSRQQKVFKVSCPTRQYQPEGRWGYSESWKRSDLLSDERGILNNDKIAVHIELKVLCGEPQSARRFLTKRFKRDESLSRDFGNMLTSSGFSDVKLTAGGKEFHVHKVVLASRSSVFAAMFEHDMLESRSNVVNVEDVKPHVMEKVLRYIYCGEFPALEGDVDAVLPVADMYQLEGLKEWCGETAQARLNVNNAASLLVLADRYNFTTFKDNVVSFIASKAHEVFRTEKWKEVAATNPQLTTQVKADVLDKLLLKNSLP